jgi:hypothetical protein
MVDWHCLVNAHHYFELEVLEYEEVGNSHLLPLLWLEVLLSHHHTDPHHLQQTHPKIKDFHNYTMSTYIRYLYIREKLLQNQ